MVMSQQTLFPEPTMAEDLIMRGTAFVGGKERIVSLYKKDMMNSERADAIRQEYGIAGGGSLIRGYLWEHDSKGIRIKEISDWKTIIDLNWYEVEEIVSRLIAEGRYL